MNRLSWSERVILLKVKSKAHLKPANLFFIELIIVLLFFSFSAAVILQIFAAADHKQELSDLTEKSVICAQSVAEAFSVKGDLAESTLFVFGESLNGDTSGKITLNDDFMPSDNGRITLSLKQTGNETAAGTLLYLDMTFMLDNTELYALTCAAYTPKGGGADE